VIFVDSSFWVALAATRDDHHAHSKALLGERAADRLVTSNHVRGEVWTFLNRRYGHGAAVRFLDLVGGTRRLRVEHVPAVLESEALEWLRARDEREYSFVDATSFALMRRLGIREAFAFDGDFGAAGFVELRAD
jgi:predicted nucleic acid-binding protein